MRMTNLTSVFVLPLLVALNVHGQSVGVGATPMLSPVPILSSGTIPTDSKQFVFLGPKASQLTISYPADIATGTGPRQTYTVKMLNQVRPVVSTAISRMPDGTFEYSYSIRNDENAGDAIRVLSLALPATDALQGLTAGSWSAASDAAPGHERPLAGAASMTPVVFSVLRDTKGTGIAPGQSITNITIRSVYRPGLTLLYSRSNDDYEVPANLPDVVAQQLAVMRAPEWKNHPTIVVGPVYPKSLPRDFVANEFSYGVARLIDGGQLKESSPGVTAIKNVLAAVSRSGGQNASLDQLQSVARTATVTENELISAIVLSLR